MIPRRKPATSWMTVRRCESFAETSNQPDVDVVDPWACIMAMKVCDEGYGNFSCWNVVCCMNHRCSSDNGLSVAHCATQLLGLCGAQWHLEAEDQYQVSACRGLVNLSSNGFINSGVINTSYTLVSFRTTFYFSF
jgi:hypothetical protein